MAGLSKTDRDLCKSLNELIFFAATSSLVHGAINKLLVIRVFGCKSLISLHAFFFYKNNIIRTTRLKFAQKLRIS